MAFDADRIVGVDTLEKDCTQCPERAAERQASGTVVEHPRYYKSLCFHTTSTHCSTSAKAGSWSGLVRLCSIAHRLRRPAFDGGTRRLGKTLLHDSSPGIMPHKEVAGSEVDGNNGMTCRIAVPSSTESGALSCA
jgi:hypothetical protein